MPFTLTPLEFIFSSDKVPSTYSCSGLCNGTRYTKSTADLFCPKRKRLTNLCPFLLTQRISIRMVVRKPLSEAKLSADSFCSVTIAGPQSVPDALLPSVASRPFAP